MRNLCRTALLLVMLLPAVLLAGCGGQDSGNGGGSQQPNTDTTQAEDSGPKQVDKLSVYFVPSREPSEIITATEPLKALLKEEMKKEGKAILMISEELSELVGMVDKLVIMKDFKVTKEFLRSPDLQQTDIIEYMI